MDAATGDAMVFLNAWGLEKRSWAEEGLGLTAAARHQGAVFLCTHPHTLEEQSPSLASASSRENDGVLPYLCTRVYYTHKSLVL